MCGCVSAVQGGIQGNIVGWLPRECCGGDIIIIETVTGHQRTRAGHNKPILDTAFINNTHQFRGRGEHRIRRKLVEKQQLSNLGQTIQITFINY